MASNVRGTHTKFKLFAILVKKRGNLREGKIVKTGVIKFPSHARLTLVSCPNSKESKQAVKG